MVHISFMRSVLGLLFVFIALKDCSNACAHQDWEMEKSKLNDVSAQKELTSTRTRKFGFGGRKMVAEHEVMVRRENEKDQDISGENNNALVKSLQGSKDQYFIHQKNVHNLKKTASLGSPRSTVTAVKLLTNPNPSPNTEHYPQDSNKLPTKASLESLSRSQKVPTHQEITATKGETQRLVEATKEIVNLMDKDYRGMDRPRRKPPINNHVPIH